MSLKEGELIPHSNVNTKNLSSHLIANDLDNFTLSDSNKQDINEILLPHQNKSSHDNNDCQSKGLLEQEQNISEVDSQASTGNGIKPYPSPMKYLQVFFVSILTLGPFIMSYGLSSIKEEFMKQFKLNNVEYNYMQSGVSFVSCITSLCEGVVTDKVGLRNSLKWYSLLCLCGYYLQFFGVYLNNFALQTIGMAMGYTFLNGLAIIQGPLISRWVGKEEYGVCVSITFMSIRIADLITSWTYPVIIEDTGNLTLAFMFGVSLLSLTLISGASCAYILDKRAEKQGFLRAGVFRKINFSHIKLLGKDLWAVVACGVAGYSSFYSFYFNSQSILEKNYSINQITAGRIFSIPFFISLTQPLFGLFLDKWKNKTAYLVSISIFLVMGYSVWAIFSSCYQDGCYKSVIPSYSLLGVFLASFPNAIWFCIHLSTPIKLQGTAYGILISLKNLGISAGGIGTGYIMDYGSVLEVLLYALGLAIICLFISIYLFFLSKNGKFTGEIPNKKITQKETDSPPPLLSQEFIE